jgi:hypothetical protein
MPQRTGALSGPKCIRNVEIHILRPTAAGTFARSVDRVEFPPVSYGSRIAAASFFGRLHASITMLMIAAVITLV